MADFSKPQDEYKDTSSDNGRMYQRFPFRAWVCILFPLALLTYYIWIYAFWLRPGSKPTSTESSHVPNGRYVYWSWFALGTFGLNISNYCLAGIEPGLLATQRFKIEKDNAEKLAYHLDKSWSTVEALNLLIKCLRDVTRRKKGKEKEKQEKKMNRPIPSKAWTLLFSISVLSWGFVLSGLTMSIDKGFARGRHTGANVLGVNATTMNARGAGTVVSSAYQRWRFGVQPQIPRWGSLYTPRGSTLITNTSTPNSLPADAGDGFFLAPQAEVPVTGPAWGLLTKYHCNGIYQLADFTILNRRINSTNPAYINNYTAADGLGNDLGNADYYYTLDDGASINVLSQFWNTDTNLRNIFAIAEIGLSRGFENLTSVDSSGYSPDFEGDPPSYRGLEDKDVLEVLLWQASKGLGVVNVTSVKNPIPGLESEHKFEGKNMPAIGIRCTSSSVTGNATLNGLTGHFGDFRRFDPEANANNVLRLGMGVSAILLPGNMSDLDFEIYDEVSFTSLFSIDRYYTVIGTQVDWVESLFTAGAVPAQLLIGDLVTYSSTMQREQLESAVLSAYQHYAMQLMFSAQENPSDEWTHPTLTATIEWPILVTGDGVPPLVALVILTFWALGCVGLQLAYGWKRRERATFDAYSCMRYCEEHSINYQSILKKS